ncbi:periplasmic heavy metal sensor [Herbaspirillum sp. HC18]|nr:periplasmic heavy metal sensor [Herbaspirillum sp. HC18]
MHILRHASVRLAAAIVLVAPILAHAQAGPGPGPERMPMMPPAHGMPCGGPPDEGPPFLRGLNLDESQRDKVFAIMHAQAPQARELRKAHDKAREALLALVRSGQYSDSKAKPIADTLGRTASEMALLHARSDSQILAVLTPEQRARSEKMQQEHMPGHGPECGPHPHR